MPNPHKAVNVEVKIDTATVGVVESMTIELEKEGGVDHYYGSDTGKHSVGGHRGTFTARRMFMVDSDTDLFYDLFNDETQFNLSGEISGVSNSQILLSDCLAYRYRPVYGAPNDKVGEEITGEATGWESTIT